MVMIPVVKAALNQKNWPTNNLMGGIRVRQTATVAIRLAHIAAETITTPSFTTRAAKMANRKG